MSDAATEVLTPAPAPAPADPSTPQGNEAELDAAGRDVLRAIAAWLRVNWEQPILRAMGSNAGRALDNAAAFPALRAALVELQAGADKTVEDAVGPLLDAASPIRDQALVSNVDAVVVDLVGLIGVPLRDAGFDPTSGGLERVQDGFRLKAMPAHDEIRAAMDTYNVKRAALAVDRAEAIERERERVRGEVTRLWAATAP